jgi:hypothetical protein
MGTRLLSDFLALGFLAFVALLLHCTRDLSPFADKQGWVTAGLLGCGAGFYAFTADLFAGTREAAEAASRRYAERSPDEGEGNGGEP